jgi:hypothetical protein
VIAGPSPGRASGRGVAGVPAYRREGCGKSCCRRARRESPHGLGKLASQGVDFAGLCLIPPFPREFRHHLVTARSVPPLECDRSDRLTCGLAARPIAAGLLVPPEGTCPIAGLGGERKDGRPVPHHGLSSFRVVPSSTNRKGRRLTMHTPTGCNWTDAIQPLETRRKTERARRDASAGKMGRRPQAAGVSQRRRVAGRAQRNWWALLPSNQ